MINRSRHNPSLKPQKTLKTADTADSAMQRNSWGNTQEVPFQTSTTLRETVINHSVNGAEILGATSPRLFCCYKTITQIQRRTLLLLQQAATTPSFGGLGLRALFSFGVTVFISLLPPRH